jgi:hypothetical protein
MDAQVRSVRRLDEAHQMNTDTGLIRRYTDSELRAAQADGERLIEIDEALMTDKQRANMAVSLNDTRSALGRELHKARSSYAPHVGAKQLAKAAKRGANTVHEPQRGSPNPTE